MDTEDRLSNLPDGILSHILSHLSTKEVVGTSILSTRWKSVWASIPTLDLREMDFCLKAESVVDVNKKFRFLSFMERVLMDKRFLEKVTIKGFCHEHSHIEQWICASIKRNVRELELVFCDAYKEPPRELPQSLFSCDTLVVLKLCLNMVLNLPVACTCLRNLKVLQLIFVIYKDGKSLQNLISSCPVLEDLTIRRVECNSSQTLNITSSTLKTLKVEYRVGFSQYQLQKIVIDASSLESIDIDDNVTEDYEVRDLSSVTRGKLHVSNYWYVLGQFSGYAVCLFQLLRRISNIKFLSLSSETMLSLSWANSYNLPKFHNLTCLEFYDGTVVEDVSWKLMLEFLNRSPILEVLVFKGFSFSWSEELETSELDVPNCLLLHLKTIQFMKVKWEPQEVEMIRYFLKKSKVLEKMTINFSKQDQNNIKLADEELQMLPKGSTACHVEIC